MTTPELPPPYIFRLSANVGGMSLPTPADLAHALRELANDLDNRTAGNPAEPFTMTPRTTIGGRLRNTYGDPSGNWAVTP